MAKLYLILDNIRSLYNVGSIFRLADATGVRIVYLCGVSGVEKFGDKVSLHPKLQKTALSGINVKWVYKETTEEAVAELKEKGVQIITVEITDQSLDYRKVEYEPSVALIVGHETDGVDDNILRLADKIVSIPMLGKGKSLNVATATAVVLYQLI